MNYPVETPTPVQAVGELASKTHNIGTLFALASRAVGEHFTDPIRNPAALGIRFFFNLTDVTGGGTATFRVQNQDPVSKSWVDVPEAVTTALAAVALTTMTLYPGIEEDANVNISNPLGSMWRLGVVVAVAPVTCSVGGVYLD